MAQQRGHVMRIRRGKGLEIRMYEGVEQQRKALDSALHFYPISNLARSLNADLLIVTDKSYATVLAVASITGLKRSRLGLSYKFRLTADLIEDHPLVGQRDPIPTRSNNPIAFGYLPGTGPVED